METKLTIHQFAELLAKSSDIDTPTTLVIVKKLAEEISADLVGKGSSLVKGLGEFKVVEAEGGYNTVAFKASDEIADTLNAPFSYFSAVELDDDYTDPEEEEEIVETEGEKEAEDNSTEDEKPTELKGLEAEKELLEQVPEATADEEVSHPEEPECPPEYPSEHAVMPEIPQTPPVPSMEEPPPFDPLKAYAPPVNGYEICSEEEEFVEEEDGARGGLQVLLWILAGIAIAVGLGALTYFIKIIYLS